jgi:hypothetical protein
VKLSSESTPRGLALITIWCWLNVVAMIPTLQDPVIVLFGFAERGPSALMLKYLILANAVLMTFALMARLHPGRILLMGWMPFMFLSSLLIEIIPSCPAPVKIAAWQQVLFGGLIPYLYVTWIPVSSFLPLHILNGAVTLGIVVYLARNGARFRWRVDRARRGRAPASGGTT